MRCLKLAAFLPLFVFGNPVYAADVEIKDRLVEIKPVHSEKCLDVAQFSKKPGAQIIQFPCTGLANQRWRIRHVGHGFHTITALHTRMCMDVKEGSSDNQAEIIQFPCLKGNNNQKFLIAKVGDVFEIRSVSSSKCLDIEGGTIIEGAKLIQFECLHQTNQRFRFNEPQ
jgi:Ricin-type beta-trefoil lectin domain